MMTRRESLKVLGAGLLASACSPLRSDGREEITFCGFGNLGEVKALREVFALFEEVNPKFRVRFIHIPQSYDSVLVTMMAGKKAPDVFYISPWILSSLLAKKALLPIDDYLRSSSVLNIDEFFPATVSPYRFDGESFGRGQTYGLCKDWSPDSLVFFNQRHFDEAGLPYPNGQWNQEEFVETARALTQRDSKNRVSQFGVFNNCWPGQWVQRAGGQIFSNSGDKCVIDSGSAIDGLEYSADLSLKWAVAPGYGEQQQGTPSVMFEAGRAAMCFYGMWMVHNFQRTMPHAEWSVVLPPRQKKDVYISSSMIGYGISSATRRPDNAWRLFEFLLSPEVQSRFARLGWNIPSNRRVAYGADFAGAKSLPSPVVKTFLDAAEKTQLFQRSPYIEPETFYRIFRSSWDNVLLGKSPVRNALVETAVAANQRIAMNREGGRK
ncbi:MAG: ABC transporter substrate-binding protein [Chthoniobacterales bacterium]